MTEARAGQAQHKRRARLPKHVLRAWAWIAGTLAFFTPWVVLGTSPRPATAEAPAKRPVVVIRKITRRVVIRQAAKPAPVRYVYTGGGGGGGSSYSAPPAPVASTGGSAPPP